MRSWVVDHRQPNQGNAIVDPIETSTKNTVNCLSVAYNGIQAAHRQDECVENSSQYRMYGAKGMMNDVSSADEYPLCLTGTTSARLSIYLVSTGCPMERASNTHPASPVSSPMPAEAPAMAIPVTAWAKLCAVPKLMQPTHRNKAPMRAIHRLPSKSCMYPTKGQMALMAKVLAL